MLSNNIDGSEEEKAECFPDGIDVTKDCVQMPLRKLMTKNFQAVWKRRVSEK